MFTVLVIVTHGFAQFHICLHWIGGWHRLRNIRQTFTTLVSFEYSKWILNWKSMWHIRKDNENENKNREFRHGKLAMRCLGVGRSSKEDENSYIEFVKWKYFVYFTITLRNEQSLFFIRFIFHIHESKKKKKTYVTKYVVFDKIMSKSYGNACIWTLSTIFEWITEKIDFMCIIVCSVHLCFAFF